MFGFSSVLVLLSFSVHLRLLCISTKSRVLCSDLKLHYVAFLSRIELRGHFRKLESQIAQQGCGGSWRLSRKRGAFDPNLAQVCAKASEFRFVMFHLRLKVFKLGANTCNFTLLLFCFCSVCSLRTALASSLSIPPLALRASLASSLPFLLFARCVCKLPFLLFARLASSLPFWQFACLCLCEFAVVFASPV